MPARSFAPTMQVEDSARTVWERSTLRSYVRSYLRADLAVLWWLRRSETGRERWRRSGDGLLGDEPVSVRCAGEVWRATGQFVFYSSFHGLAGYHD